ncbi:DUF6838 family protein [Gorillibacterium sp. CAU 1737]|uniref:phage tail terminator family protein n=1 Tax=Gorillibacterium sp. CAU 1737 TaxID=3140362 RepID=UPI003261B1A4
MALTQAIRTSLEELLRGFNPAISIRGIDNPPPAEPYWELTLQTSGSTRETGQRIRQSDGFQLGLIGAGEEVGMEAISYLFEQLEYLSIPGRTLAGTEISAERTDSGLMIRVRYVYHMLKARPAVPKMQTLQQKGTIAHGEA